MTSSIFYGISLGTGDPELITVKGLKILQKASVVAFPAGIGHNRGIAERIVTPWLTAQQLKLGLHFPYVQDEYLLNQAWKNAAEQIWEHLQLKENVVFVCEGDVSFYSTFTYLAQTLTQLHPEVTIQTIPGVCSPMAAASVLGLPLTVHRQRLAILPALYALKDLDNAIAWADVIVLMKVSSVYREVWQWLEQKNLLNQSWIVEKATFPEQVIYRDLENLPQLSLSYFSILIIQTSLKTDV